MMLRFPEDARLDVDACLAQALGEDAVVCVRDWAAWADHPSHDEDDITLAQDEAGLMKGLIQHVMAALFELPDQADAQVIITHLDQVLGARFAQQPVYDYAGGWHNRPRFEQVEEQQLVPLHRNPERILLLAEEAVVGLAPFVANPEVAHWAATRLARLDRGDDLAHFHERLARGREANLAQLPAPILSSRRFRA